MHDLSDAELVERAENGAPEAVGLLYDRHSDWSVLEKFQRTRGVLRLMAAVIHTLWERNDSSLLIMPANVPIDASSVQSELTRYLEDNWLPVIEKDVDGPASLPLVLDQENPNLGRYSASRRVARTIYMGLAPTARTKNPGLDERNVKMGCVQPGESPATFGDALRRLTDKATHLYVDRSRYWFSTQPSVTRLAQDRAAQIDILDVWMELKRRLWGDRQRGELTAVHTVPDSSGDVPDDDSVRLVILGPNHPHASRDETSPGLAESRAVLGQRGSAPRLYQNMLVFLAPDRNRLNDLEQAIRQHLAWQSIYNEREILNLDTFQRNQAETKHEQADETVAARIQETYVWLLVPYRSDPRNPETLVLEAYRLQGADPLAVRASRKLINDELLITEFSGICLRMVLDRFNLWQDSNHIGTKRLWEYLARYPYLPRLKNQEVLRTAVQEGVNRADWTDNFAYAQSYDNERGRYLNLLAGSSGVVTLDSHSVIVQVEAAQEQIARDKAEAAQQEQARAAKIEAYTVQETEGDDEGETAVIPPPPQPPTEKKLRRFYGSVELDSARVVKEVGTIAESIIQHLEALVGADVTITLEIHADVPDGVPEQVARTVTENANTLKFGVHGFEEG